MSKCERQRDRQATEKRFLCAHSIDIVTKSIRGRSAKLWSCTTHVGSERVNTQSKCRIPNLCQKRWVIPNYNKNLICSSDIINSFFFLFDYFLDYYIILYCRIIGKMKKNKLFKGWKLCGKKKKLLIMSNFFFFPT